MAKILHLFVIDPIETLNFALDSSLRIARALRNIGHETYICTPSQIEWASREGCAVAYAQGLHSDINDVARYRLDPLERLPLTHFRAIHMRKDPPYDLTYITCTWLLDSAEKAGVKVLNSPRALRDYNEKLSIFQFPEAIQDGLISTNPDSLLRFLKNEAKGDAVLKPLTLFGGRGVLRLALATHSEAEIYQTLLEETAKGVDHRLIQPFDKRIFEGEVRVFTAGGKAVSWCLKKPHGDNFLANTRSGATLEPYTPSNEDVHRIESIAKSLLKAGIYFLGFDVIGGLVSEINLTSPRLLQAPGESVEPYDQIAAMLEKDL
jgi:glutathione synthase